MRRAVLLLVLSAGCRDKPKADPQPVPSTPLSRLERFVQDAGFRSDLARGGQITPPDSDITGLLDEFRRAGRRDHIPLLAEYALKLHWINLEHTGLARDLPTSNPMIREFAELTALPRYHSAYEAGWLLRQFEGTPAFEGWSSYQVYVWLKERSSCVMEYSNAARLESLLRTIDTSGLAGVGGGGVCHYGCE